MDGGWWRDVLSFASSHPILFPPSSDAGDTACPGLLPEVCERVNTVAVEMRRWAAVYLCVCMYSSSSLPSFSFGFFSLLAFVFLASHDHQFAGPLCAPLFLSLERRRRGEGQSQMAECGCGFMSCWWRLNATVYTSQLPLRSRLNSVKLLCLHALFLCNLNELLSNITALLFDRERSQLSLFNPVSLKLWVLTQSGYRHYILTPILRLGDMTIYPVRLISQSAEILHTVYSNISLL